MSCDMHYGLAGVEDGRERADLLSQPVYEFARAAHRQRGNIVNGLVGIKFDALSANGRHRFDDVRAQTEKAELKDGE